MGSRNSVQMINGKAFEYSLLCEFKNKLKDKTNVQIIKNSFYFIAKNCFEKTSKFEQSKYLLTSSFAVNFLIDLEPKLSNDINEKDILQLEICSDDKGKNGDVRDVLAIRVLQKWEIGVSAKNNHNAVKHSRLSSNIDFGNNWFGINVSKEYFEEVNPIFDKLKNIRIESNKTRKWSEIGDYHSFVYIPVLNAFMKELKRISKENENIPSKLISSLVGNKDFYKIIKKKNKVEIEAFNLTGNLNQSFKSINSKYNVPKIPLPTKIIDIRFKQNSKTTIIVDFDNDWTLSFRIHNASSRVEASLKFDINLLKSPKKLFKNTLEFQEELK